MDLGSHSCYRHDFDNAHEVQKSWLQHSVDEKLPAFIYDATVIIL